MQSKKLFFRVLTSKRGRTLNLIECRLAPEKEVWI